MTSRKRSGGFAVDPPDDLLSFIEVLQQNQGLYDGWYSGRNYSLTDVHAARVVRKIIA